MSTKNKLLFLLLTMLVGLGSLSYLLYKQQLSTQYQMKTLYFGSLIPVSNLKEINVLLQRDIKLKVFEARRDLKALDAKEIMATEKQVMKLWMEYATQYKSKDEKTFISHVDMKMQQLHTYLLHLAQKVKNLAKKESGISYRSLSKGINDINSVIGKLVAYELKLAHASRKDLLTHYEERKIIIFATLAIIILISMILFVGISNSIKASERSLQHLAINLQHANEELHTASITDAMTGLYNRRFFDQIFMNEIQRAQREGLSLTFMMVDIDYFKKYNDFYGHPAGDQVIKRVAQHLSNTFKRPNDLIFRLGGEEFGLLVLATSEEMVSFMADKMVKQMQELAIEHLHSEVANYLTISLGMTHFAKARLIDAKELYEMTDKVLYRAKESGRNKIVTELLS